MLNLTPDGETLVHEVARRYSLSADAVLAMLTALQRGHGTMAQFNIPELGGNGQWMLGGMTMVGDMFNHGLKMTVDNLCNELSQAASTMMLFKPVPHGGALHWWPQELGTPSSTGGQNDSSYAVFPETRRLAISEGGQVRVYDTGDHMIAGVSQQQGGTASLTFSSQLGSFPVSSLRLLLGNTDARSDPVPDDQPPGSPQTAFSPAEVSAPAPAVLPLNERAMEPRRGLASGADEIIALLEKLGALRDAGILTDEEFSAKKQELLARL
jgi:hypothetical protein